MFRRYKFLVALLLVFGLLAANVGVYTAHAHNWGGWHWDKGGTQIVIQEQHTGGHTTQSLAASLDAWNRISILFNYHVNYHTDISVYDGYYNTNWSGLASIEDSNWDWGCWCYDHIGHAHAKYNTKSGFSAWTIQGVYCQEINHGRGFDHDNSGGCMGLTYYSGSSNTLSSHNLTDFYNRYRNH